MERAVLRVLLAEDHIMIRSGLRALLEKSGEVVVVGEAANGREALQLAERLRPDLVVMDLAMPELTGIEATRELHARGGPPVVILSMHGDRQYVFEALHAGAMGYVRKDEAFSELVAALRAVAAGGRYLGASVRAVAVEDYMLRAQGEPLPVKLDLLSAREREVLQLIAEGRTNAEAAAALCISPHTVDSHRRHLMEKLGARNLPELVKLAIRLGVTSLE